MKAEDFTRNVKLESVLIAFSRTKQPRYVWILGREHKGEPLPDQPVAPPY
jgi:hypothetical protein